MLSRVSEGKKLQQIHNRDPRELDFGLIYTIFRVLVKSLGFEAAKCKSIPEELDFETTVSLNEPVNVD